MNPKEKVFKALLIYWQLEIVSPLAGGIKYLFVHLLCIGNFFTQLKQPQANTFRVIGFVK